MKELFIQFSTLIIFLHVMSAVIWVGGMIAMRYAVHYSMQKQLESTIRLERSLENLKKFFYLILPFIVLLLGTAFIMIFGLELKDTPLYKFVLVKEALWTIMTIIYITVYVKRYKAEKAFLKSDFMTTKVQLQSIANIFIPVNIVLGLVAVYLGVTLRGF